MGWRLGTVLWAVCLASACRASVAASRPGTGGHHDAPADAVPGTDRSAPGPLNAQPVLAVLGRVVGAAVAGAFDLRVDPTMPQGFVLSSTGGGRCGEHNASAQNRTNPTTATRIQVTASGLPELAYGCAYYLRKYAHMRSGTCFAWERTGGNQVAVPPSGLPPVPSALTVRKRAKWTYYQNVCTQSYSMWWWDWPRWEREIDWMALWGVNIVLAYTGQEKVFRSVFNGIGVNDSILNQTFDGPAFLTWSRGQGTFGFGGPLPNYWIEAQADLQVKIMGRLRELGIAGILPGFQGNVPQAMPELFPKANTSGGWLDALDPLFKTIASGIGAGVQAEFGPSNFVEADGWFSLETGPWLTSAPPSSGGTASPAAAAAASSSSSSSSSAGVRGSCFGGFVIPSEEEAFTRAQSVFASLTAANPNATWVYQGYPWFRVYSQGASCNQTALRLFIRGFTRAIPRDRLLVLDLVADSPGDALWRYPDSPALGRFAQNASLVWCALNNWGGAVHKSGDLSYVLNETRAAMATPGVAGVGLTPEGIDNSAAYFSLVLDAPWTAAPSAAEWYQEWGHGRCGRAGVPEAEQAYALLFATLYRPGQPYLWCCSQPRFCPTVLPGSSVARPAYNITLLQEALALMIRAAPSCRTAAFRFDLVDVAREWLSMKPCLERLDKVDPHGTPDALRAQVAALLEVYEDVDAMMGTDSGFLLGLWLKNSRAVADWDGSSGALAGFYEWNSRVQISSWAGAYSRREWSGMIATYYAERARIWLQYTLNTTTAPAPLPGVEAGRALPAGAYQPVPGVDCNFDDLPVSKCHGAACTVAQLEALCNATARCIAFNSPGGFLKSGCTHPVDVPQSTIYFRPGHYPPSMPTSSCVAGFCSTHVANGTHHGTTCDGQCPLRPAPPPLPQQLAAFDVRWQNETWSPDVLPAEPRGDPVQLAARLLAKYGGGGL